MPVSVPQFSNYYVKTLLSTSLSCSNASQYSTISPHRRVNKYYCEICNTYSYLRDRKYRTCSTDLSHSENIKPKSPTKPCTSHS